ncbi:hypothetical protein E0K89_016045 [Aquicoccus sp. SCR17]|nr:hypothetical protein [Carideicomes alvinocaridis]
MGYKPKNLTQPEFDIALSIDLPELAQTGQANYAKLYNKKWSTLYDKMLKSFLKKYDDAIKHLDNKISDRVKNLETLRKSLANKKLIRDTKSAKEMIALWRDEIKQAEELDKVISAYTPMLQNAVRTFEGQVRSKAEDVQTLVEKELEKKGQGVAKAAKRNTWVKIGIVVGVALVGLAVGVAVIATGGAALAPIALGLGIAALVVGTASGFAGCVKAYQGFHNALKVEQSKLEEHLGKFEKAVTAYEKYQAEKKAKDMGLIDFKTKTTGKREVERKSAMASLSKARKHAERVSALSLKLRMQVRDDKKKAAEIRSNALKADADFKKAKSALKDAKMTNVHEDTNKQMLQLADLLDKRLETLETKAKALADLLDQFNQLQKDVESGKKKKADISGATKRMWRTINYIPEVLGHLNNATSAASGMSSAATS